MRAGKKKKRSWNRICSRLWKTPWRTGWEIYIARRGAGGLSLIQSWSPVFLCLISRHMKSFVLNLRYLRYQCNKSRDKKKKKASTGLFKGEGLHLHHHGSWWSRFLTARMRRNSNPPRSPLSPTLRQFELLLNWAIWRSAWNSVLRVCFLNLPSDTRSVHVHYLFKIKAQGRSNGYKSNKNVAYDGKYRDIC